MALRKFFAWIYRHYHNLMQIRDTPHAIAGGLDAADREVEFFEGHAFQRFMEDLPGQGKKVLPKRQSAADKVLP